MSSFVSNKRFISIGIILTFITLLTIFYIHFPTKHYDTSFQNVRLNLSKNHTHIRSPRICCLIVTSPNSFLTRTKAINQTWAPRCDRYFFITEYSRETMTHEQITFAEKIPIAPIKGIIPGYDHLTQKSVLAFLYTYENYFVDFDWFVKADDDTYLIVENLKKFLNEQNTSEPITFGYNYKTVVEKGYQSGGASYVLSRESLRRFYEAQKDRMPDCQQDGGSEDIEIAKCLRTKGVYPGKSLDKQNRELFHPFTFVDHFRGSFPDWLQQYAENPLRTHYDCCGDESISFHYVKPEEQYFMDFLLYRTHPKSNII